MRITSFLLCFVAMALLANDAFAKPKKKKRQRKAKVTKVEVDEATEQKNKEVAAAILKLSSKDAEAVLEGVRQLAILGSKEAVEPLISLLSSGPRNEITNAIIETLGAIGDEKAIPVLIQYTKHRRPDARVAAVFALEGVNDSRVVRALEACLRDSDSRVRNMAALALGKKGSVASVPLLFLAFKRGVVDAASAIGQLGTPKDADKLAGYLGKRNISILLPGFNQFLARKDFTETQKIWILGQLLELAGPEVRRFAIRYRASFPPETAVESNELYRYVGEMIKKIPQK